MLIFSRRWYENFPCLSTSKKWAGSSPVLGFSKRDAYNSIANEVKRTWDGGDANHLMCVSETRCVNEQDFFL